MSIQPLPLRNWQQRIGKWSEILNIDGRLEKQLAFLPMRRLK
jgi:hypothetical protein